MRSTIAILGLVLVSACSSAATKSSTAAAAAPRGSRDLITRTQIDQMSVQDAYEIVSRMRPEYLREQRGPSSVNRGAVLAVVYIDGVRRGGPEALRGLRPGEVEEIRFMSATDATTRYGTDHAAGVIEIKSRHGR
ncbi:MAG: hypothetical protein ACREMA_04630 [Longimicrobiales bacterium]